MTERGGEGDWLGGREQEMTWAFFLHDLEKLHLRTFVICNNAVAAAAKSLQSCPTLCDPIDGSPPGSPVPGIPQARTLEWVAISFSNARKWKVKVKSLSCVQLLVTPWTAAYQAPPPMGFSRQEYWSGVPLPSPICNNKWPLLFKLEEFIVLLFMEEYLIAWRSLSVKLRLKGVKWLAQSSSL